jgi:Flp pilus assembly protein TadG
LFKCESGTAVLEQVIVMTALLGLLFGIINFGMVLWVQSSLYYSVESAARCASVNAATCGSPGAIQTYAWNQYFGQSVGATNPFSYSASGCGHTVSGNYTYSLSIPLFGTYSIPLSATACFP